MTRKATTVRLSEDLADTAEVVASARRVSVNQVILDALEVEADRDKEIPDRLAE